jgi:predicted phosphodiesterase
MSPFRIAAVALCPALLLPAQDKIVGGPYVVKVTRDSAVIGWVEEAKGGELSVVKQGLKNLKPGSVVEKGTPAGPVRFKAAHAAGQPYSFVVFGDTRSRHDLHQRVIDAISQAKPDFVIHTGDLVADGDAKEQWPRFFQIEKNLLNQTAFFPTIGNHEKNNKVFYDCFDLSEAYYSFDWGDAHFAILNSDLGNYAEESALRDKYWQQQLKWLDQDLAASKAGRRFVVMHHPPYTAMGRRQKEVPMFKDAVALFIKHKVTAVFNGHDHNYQHHLADGIHYFVSGGGGAPLYGLDKPIPGVTLKGESTEHYIVIRSDGRGSAELEAVALDGRSLDKVSFLAVALPGGK